jgi:hypothetical protein
MTAPDPDDVCRIAQNLARNRDYAVLPCRLVVLDNGTIKKVPARSKQQGGQGYKDATKDPNQIAWQWHNWPGDLIGVATGAISNIILLDFDVKHDEARAFYHTNRNRLPITRTFRSYSGGLHLHYRYTQGIGLAGGEQIKGVDVRGDGGMMIYWFAFGLHCIDHSPPAPWPDWLTPIIWPPKLKLTPTQIKRFDAHPDRTIDRILQRIAQTANGSRNSALNKGAYAIGIRVAAGQISRSEAEARLEAAALAAGMNHKEDGIIRTIQSGLEAALS